MRGSIFTDKSIKPDEQMLETELAASFSYYLEICRYIKENFGELVPEWKFYGKNNGWLLKLLNKNRNILFINPQSEYFKTTFTFSEHASKEVLYSNIDNAIKDELLKAKKYSEGKVIQVLIKSESDLESVLKLINIKIKN